jgi:hypothetical protein
MLTLTVYAHLFEKTRVVAAAAIEAVMTAGRRKIKSWVPNQVPISRFVRFEFVLSLCFA